MKEECTKFEGLFVFSNKDFEAHLESCETCRAKKAEFDKVSALIKEAKPLYFRQKAKRAKLRAVALFFIFVLAGAMFGIFGFFGQNNEILCAEDYGFPVDSYGLIMVDE